MIPKDYTADEVAAMTPTAAAKRFHSHVADQMKDGTGFDEAFNAIKEALPKLFARACTMPNEEPVEEVTSLANVADRLALPADRSGINRQMKLPHDADEGITRAALAANGGRTTPLNARDVWAGVVGRLASVKNYSVETAQSVARDQFPELTRAAGQEYNNPLGVPPNWQDYLKNMALPGNTTYEEFVTCWSIVNDKPVTADAQNVFRALTAYYLRTTHFLRQPQAESQVAAKFTALAAAAGKTGC